MKAMRPRPIPEKAVQAQIAQLLRTLGAAVFVIGTTRRRGDYQGTMMTLGIPDIYAILPAPKLAGGAPTGLWVEVKRRGGRLRPEQATFRAHCRAASIPHLVGGVGEVVSFLVHGGWLSSSAVPHYRLKGE